MKKFIISFYDWDEEFEYERRTMEFLDYDEMMEFAGKRCQEIMVEKDLPSICWHYVEVDNA